MALATTRSQIEMNINSVSFQELPLKTTSCFVYLTSFMVQIAFHLPWWTSLVRQQYQIVTFLDSPQIKELFWYKCLITDSQSSRTSHILCINSSLLYCLCKPYLFTTLAKFTTRTEKLELEQGQLNITRFSSHELHSKKTFQFVYLTTIHAYKVQLAFLLPWWTSPLRL